MQGPAAIQPCDPRTRRRYPEMHSLRARLFALDQIGRTRALTDRESVELERLLNAKAQRDLRKR